MHTRLGLKGVARQGRGLARLGKGMAGNEQGNGVPWPCPQSLLRTWYLTAALTEAHQHDALRLDSCQCKSCISEAQGEGLPGIPGARLPALHTHERVLTCPALAYIHVSTCAALAHTHERRHRCAKDNERKAKQGRQSKGGKRKCVSALSTPAHTRLSTCTLFSGDELLDVTHVARFVCRTLTPTKERRNE
jgi:hypothetical protein